MATDARPRSGRLAPGRCRRSFLFTAGVGAAVLAILGVLSTRPPTLPIAAVAASIAVLAQFGALRFRQGSRIIYLGWGEAALIAVAYLVPAGWAPSLMGVGALVGQVLYRLRTRTALAWRVIRNAANLTLASVAGVAAANAVGGNVVRRPYPLPVIGLVVGALVYSLVGTAFVNFVSGLSARDFAVSAARTLRGKLPMIVGNVTLGVIFVAVFDNDLTWLLAMPALLALTYQVYVFRSRATEERRLWREFTEVARSINQLDEPGVGRGAVAGVLRMFDATAVEMWVDGVAAPARGYRCEARPSGTAVSEFADEPSRGARRPDMVHPLATGGLRVGELRVWLPPGPVPRQRNEMVISALGETIAGALHDASASSALQALTERGRHRDGYDSLTGLSTAAAFVQDGDTDLAALPPDRPVALLVLGINRFKEVNDSLGHLAGDDLLREVALRLVAFAQGGERVGRLAGDTFAVLILDAGAPVSPGGQPPTGQPLAGPPPAGQASAAPGHGADVLSRARDLAARIAEPAHVRGMRVAVEASIGVASGPAGQAGVNELIRRADIAMHRAKRGTGPVAEYGSDPADIAAADPERLLLVLELRDAIAAGGQFVLDALPVLDLDTGVPQRVEALVAWRHPRRGLLAMAEFADLLDIGGLAGAFARHVIDEALALRGRWRAQGLDLPISVNLPPRSLLDPSLPADVESLLKAHGAASSRLILEITEAAVPEGRPAIDDALRALRAAGVQIAVDDFGTGTATLALLTRVQVDEVKVDASFVAAMTTSAEAAAIVRISVDLGHRLGVRVIAQGVDTAAERATLREMGCRAGQGTHLVPATAPERAVGILRDLIATARSNRPFPIS